MGLPCFSIMKIEKQGNFLWREKIWIWGLNLSTNRGHFA